MTGINFIKYELIQPQLKQRTKSFEGYDDSSLEKIFRLGLRCARGVNPSIASFTRPIPHEVYEGIAAERILTKRHGKDYVLTIQGLRRPKNFYERTILYLTGRFPKDKSGSDTPENSHIEHNKSHRIEKAEATEYIESYLRKLA